jgi:hypothetical protein
VGSRQNEASRVKLTWGAHIFLMTIVHTLPIQNVLEKQKRYSFRNHYFYFVLRVGTNKNISTHLPCSGMTPKGQTVQGEWVLLKLGLVGKYVWNSTEFHN